MNKFKVPVIAMSTSVDETAKVAELTIEGEIGWAEYDGNELKWNTSAAIRSQLQTLLETNVDHIVVNIHSLGGYVDDALAIHDALVMHPASVTTRVTGFTASAATIIAQAGNAREISDNAMYLVHEAWGLSIGTETLLLQELEHLRAVNNNMAKLYAKRAGRGPEEYRAIMAENEGVGKWITATEAVDKGFADTVIEMKPVINGFLGNMLSMFGSQIPEPPAAAAAPQIDIPAPSGEAIQYAQARQRTAELLTQIMK
jgi:ATP-dependent Clp protease, protease subunit